MLPLMVLLPSLLQRTTFNIENLDLSGMSQDWGTPHRNKSVDGVPMKIGGRSFDRGIGTHANSELDVRLRGNAAVFDSWVGVDSEAKGGPGSVVFQVYGDGRLLAYTGVLHGGDLPMRMHVDLSGVRVMRLVVDDAGDGIDSDHADWANPSLTLIDANKIPVVAHVTAEAPMPIAGHISSRSEIHGPKVIGTTPGKPFLFRIPATGLKPLRYQAVGLPDGLVVDQERGIISGRVSSQGVTIARLFVEGPGGRATRSLRIVAGPHDLAMTPPMGWNSWNVWAGAVDADKVRAAADQFVKTGLADFGYQYVNIDDTWEGTRDATGELHTNKKFGDITALSTYAHGLGLKLGIYSSPGPKTCGGYAGSYQHELQDAQSYAKWGIDYLKYDWCSYGGIDPRPSTEGLQRPYMVMRDALDHVDRDIVYSLCQYGMGDVWKWGSLVGGNLWRTTGDINDSWRSMSRNGFSQSPASPYAGPGAWNDPDMLVVGHLGWGSQTHQTHLTPNEQITHITLWSMLAAPLMIGCDLTRLDSFTEDLLMNSDVIDVDQDSLGSAATRRVKNGDQEIWARRLSDGATAVALFNRGADGATVSVNWKDVGLPDASYPVRNLWLRQDLGRFEGAYSARVPAHGAVLIKVGTPDRS